MRRDSGDPRDTDELWPQWIGWDYTGAVEQLGPEAIVTRFFCVIVPVRADRSYYQYVTPDGERAAFEIPRHRRSVVLGFLRMPLWLATIVVAAGAVFAFERWGYLLPVAFVLGGAAAVVTFVLGNLSVAERERRALLRRVSGLGAPPELLPPQLLDTIRDALADAWYREHRVPWRSSILRGDASEALVALAEYFVERPLLIRARTNLIAAEGN